MANAASEPQGSLVGKSAGDRPKGYTYLEYYLNERADALVPK